MMRSQDCLLHPPPLVWIYAEPLVWIRVFFGAPSMGARLWVKVPLRAGHSEQSEARPREVNRACELNVEIKSGTDRT